MTNRRDDSIGRWWDRSWTLVRGCTWPDGEMPPACERCWARSMSRRFRPGELEGVTTIPESLDLPLRTKRPTVFAVQIAYGDLFHDAVPGGFIERVFDIAEDEQRHTFVVLTKRPERAADFATRILPARPNVYLLASCWDQASVDAACRAFATLPPGIRWGLHLEPLLGPVDLHVKCGGCGVARGEHAEYFGEPCEERWSGDPNEPPYPDRCGYWEMGPSWVVVGGETGPGARPMHPDWVRNLRDQCQSAGVPFYLKSLGRKGERTLDGREHNAVPWEGDR